ncbi:hypothetical protein [Prosthecobacter sp.]|uniref:hypothetical protein n=1 Tax=Prosthecobacter sp. TaxID=1965333 RepID=UPI0037838510
MHTAQNTSSHEISTPDGIRVHCLHAEIVPADQLKLFPGNYRKHKAKQLDRMLKVVNGNGWRRCAVVSKLSGYVIKGNGMVQLAQRNGLHVPIEYQDYKSRAEELRDLVADNKLAELAEDDDDALKKLLSEIDVADLECAAVTSEELEALIRDAEIPEAEFPITAKLHERYDYVLVFTTNESDFAFLQTLTGVEPERSYKKSGIGIGRAIPFTRFLKSIRENRHSLDVQG